MKKVYLALILGLVVSACASKDETLNLPAENLYNLAYDNLEQTKYKKAAEQFEQLETQHPYSKWAVKSKLMAVPFLWRLLKSLLKKNTRVEMSQQLYLGDFRYQTSYLMFASQHVLYQHLFF